MARRASKTHDKAGCLRRHIDCGLMRDHLGRNHAFASQFIDLIRVVTEGL
jgi:hypothetical protein